jgi:hypothetical protein
MTKGAVLLFNVVIHALPSLLRVRVRGVFQVDRGAWRKTPNGRQEGVPCLRETFYTGNFGINAANIPNKPRFFDR